MPAKPKRSIGLAILGLVLGGLLLCAAAYWVYPIAARNYTIASLNWARSQGVYDTPQQGLISSAYQHYCGVEKVEIEQAATNSFDGSDPHVWFVLYTIYAKNHAPCDPEHPGAEMYHNEGFERGGVFYLNVKEGWVFMPEGRFPEFIGYWMKKLDLAGPGDSTHVPRDY
jgi:hypothetical protein